MSQILEVPPELDVALNRYFKNIPTILKGSVRSVLKILQTLQKRPADIKSRKLRMENLVIKKFVLDVDGAFEVLKVLGFRENGVAKKAYLEVPEDAVNLGFLNRTIDLLTSKADDLDAAEKTATAPAAAKVLCSGGCGFWGDAKYESLCSICYKKKYFGVTGQENKEVAPTLCTLKCGLWGSAKFNGMCSQCYAKTNVPKPKHWRQRFRSAIVKVKAMRSFQLSLRSQQTDKTRCWTCRKRVGITGIECRCRYIFCAQHRFPGEHDCPYDFKKAHKRKLMKENMKVTKNKFDKIDGQPDE